jgi:hypothetical protein
MPKISGDELFVPASHLLVIDRQVSHPAFRLWCVLHRLWFLHEPPTMELLQELMGTAVEEKDKPKVNGHYPTHWQPATRRSIERWLTELEQAGWLVWTRREETSRRYHLRTSARSAFDSAVLHEIRTLLNSGKATLVEVQALLRLTPGMSDDATTGSHESIPGSHQDAVPGFPAVTDATSASHSVTGPRLTATAGSHGATEGSYRATVESQSATEGSHEATAESHTATEGSHAGRGKGFQMPQNEPPYNEISENKIQEDPTPPPAAEGGDGGGPTLTERYLLREGFSARAAHEFRQLDVKAVQADLERRRGFGQGIGAIVTTWRIEPPLTVPTLNDTDVSAASRSVSAKAAALALAPVDAGPLEIQYLALDLEEGVPHKVALANLLARREDLPVGGVA